MDLMKEAAPELPAHVPGATLSKTVTEASLRKEALHEEWQKNYTEQKQANLLKVEQEILAKR